MQKISLVLRHYNRLKPMDCTVISGDTSKLFTIRLNDNESKGTEMFKGDPVLIGTLTNSDAIQINGGNVIGVTGKCETYIICSNEVVNIAAEMEKRQHERYPASLLGDIKSIASNKREDACIKDISYSGMCIFSTGEYNVDDIVEVTIYLSNTVSIFDGKVVRKSKNFGRNEYGIQIIHRDKNAVYAAQAQLANLIQNERDLMYKHLLNSNFKL